MIAMLCFRKVRRVIILIRQIQNLFRQEFIALLTHDEISSPLIDLSSNGRFEFDDKMRRNGRASKREPDEDGSGKMAPANLP